MARQAKFSPQTRAVLAVFGADPTAWMHGYSIAQQTGLRSGTLYPILIRLAEQHLIEARWEDEQPAGRPRRHLYLLTATGRAVASAVDTATTGVTAASQAKAGRSVGRLATDGGA